MEKQKPPLGGNILVAGPGFAPGPSDYEPDEVLFLHPAIMYSDFLVCHDGENTVLPSNKENLRFPLYNSRNLSENS